MRLTYPLLLLVIIGLFAGTVLVGRNALTAPSMAPENGPVRMIRFVLSNDGLYPRRLQVDQGRVNIAVEDKTAASAGLVIESIIDNQRTRVSQISRRDERRGRALIRLTPGKYLVSDASQPSHTAELIVNP